MQSSFELVGKVKSVERRRYRRNSDATKFTVLDSRGGNTTPVTCVCSFFCPIHVNDLIVATCVKKEKEVHITKPPFVRVGADRESIVDYFCKNVRGLGPIRGGNLYDFIERIAGAGKVDQHLSGLAESWMKTGDDQILQSFTEFINDSSFSYLLMQWYHKFDKRRLHLLGLTNTEISECEKISGSYYKIYEMCLNNPFILYPIPEAKCMVILNRLKRPPKREDIECGKIVRKMYENMVVRGWTCTPVTFLAQEFKELRDVGPTLLKDYGVVKEYDCAYLGYPHKVESFVSGHLSKLIHSDTINDTTTEFVHPNDYNPVSPIHSRMEAEFRASATLSEDQKRAIQGALDHKISIITGGPGTGKTMSIKEIVYNLEQRNLDYAICAFTGKAVARLRSILCSTVPMTFHLKIKKQKSARFKVLIVDEASMVTTELLYTFIQCFDFPFNIVFVGDPDQLPPIGWGSLFSECIASKTIPKYELVVNHRVYDIEGEQDGILLNTKRMAKHGADETLKMGAKAPSMPMKFTPTGNFVLVPGNIDQISAFAHAFKHQGIRAHDITVITPYNKDVTIINGAFQKLYTCVNADTKEENECAFDSRGFKWYLHDRVMMTKNDYEINVMNGEEGEVMEVHSDKIKVAFGPGRSFDFPLEPTKRRYGTSKEKDDEYGGDEERTVKKLVHSYCVTVHRAQGSEWDYVIFYLPIGRSQPSYITKNLVYTGLTRAKRALFFIGNIPELEASTTRSLPFRCEKLTKRLGETLEVWEADQGALRDGEDDYHNHYEDDEDEYEPEWDGY